MSDRTDERSPAVADEIVDQLVPHGLDWRRWVRDYPLISIGIAAATGYLVARWHGESLVEGVSTRAVDRVTENVQSLVDERIAKTLR